MGLRGWVAGAVLWAAAVACAPAAPTAVPVPARAEPVAPTAVPVPATAEPVAPTAVPVAPTAVPVAPTAVPVAPTAVPVPTTVAPTATPVPPRGVALGPTAVPTVEPTRVLALKPLVLGPRRLALAPPPLVTAEHVAILDEDSGELLFGLGEHDRVAPASITKIATTLVALEREPDLARRIDVTVSGAAMAARNGSSIMGLEPGENVSLETLLYGMMLPSGNDAAEQVALELGGSRETYVSWMNQRVAALGLRNTHFINPSGLDANGHYSSAYDMALLGREAMQNERFRRLAAAATYHGDGYRLSNLNRLIGVYPGTDGIKIGSTRRAGKTSVASVMHDGHRVYVTLMHSSDLPGDATQLFNWVWRSFAW